MSGDVVMKTLQLSTSHPRLPKELKRKFLSTNTKQSSEMYESVKLLACEQNNVVFIVVFILNICYLRPATLLNISLFLSMISKYNVK